MSDDRETGLITTGGVPLTREDLDGLGDHEREAHTPLVMQPECHKRAAMAASYCRDCGTLTLQCADCGKAVAGFAIGVRARH